MALPNHEDLMRLKSFIEFVTVNPTILNFPQLDFVKKFIEQFGGKVPDGEFKMPGGGKCPFGGDTGVKSETKSAEAEKGSEPEEAAMESDSESEVELDMEVGSYSCHDHDESHEGIGRVSNAIFLKETKEIRKSCRIRPRAKKELSEDEDECNMDESYEHRAGTEGIYEEDPINTTGVDVIIKTEFDNERDRDDYDDEMGMANVEDEVSDYQTEDESEEENGDSNEDYKVKRLRRRHTVKRKKTQIKQKSATSSSRLTRSSNQKSKECWKPKRTKKPKPITCGEKCKQKCKEKIDKDQRQQLCTEFWVLDFVGRKNYILKWVETRKVCTIRRSNKPTRAYTNRYFLQGSDGEKKRVCHSFFLTTLSVSGYVIKNAFKDSDGKGHYIGYDKRSRKSAPQAVPPTVEADRLKEGDESQRPAMAESENDMPEVQEETSVPQSQLQTDEHPKPKTGWNKGKKLKKDHVPQPVNCDESCQMKCTSHFTEEQRAQMCATFWTMDYKRRKDFVLSRIETREVECITAKEYRKTNRAIRSCSNRYFFRGARGDNVRVCAKFFTATLCIGRQVIHNALKNADQQTGAYIGEDKRGRHTPGNKISDEMLAEVKRHIESYPTWVPHKNYKTRFLHSSLNIRRMYREYQQMCTEQQRKFVGKGYFSTVFHKQYRLAFLKPTSKHDHKVSAVKRDMNAPIEIPAKKVNTNISEYTGEEGGFWLRPHATGATVEPEQNVYAAPNRVQIEENVQIHTLQPYPAATTTNYLQSIPGEQVLPQRDSQVVLSNFAQPVYEQYSSVFRML